MNKIDARSKSVRELLDGVKYTIDYYQREYKWETKQISELLEDLESKFLDNYKEGHERTQVQHYSHYFLGSIIISKQSGVASSFYTYVSREEKKPFEIEHIWADQYERHTDEFATEEEFAQYRNRIGGLLLLPRGFNQSFGAAPYEKKVKAYFGQNLLAKSLNEQCYQNNPSFLAYIKHCGLCFKAYPNEFKKANLDARQDLYQRICEEIWSPSRFDSELM